MGRDLLVLRVKRRMLHDRSQYSGDAVGEAAVTIARTNGVARAFKPRSSAWDPVRARPGESERFTRCRERRSVTHAVSFADAAGRIVRPCARGMMGFLVRHSTRLICRRIFSFLAIWSTRTLRVSAQSPTHEQELAADLRFSERSRSFRFPTTRPAVEGAKE